MNTSPNNSINRESVNNLTLFLNNLAINGPDDKDLYSGICVLVEKEFGLLIRWKLIEMMTKWPHYSGNRSFPIPGGPARYLYTDNMWDMNTEYGRLRRDLCSFLATQLQYLDVAWFLEDLATKRREPYYHVIGICGNIIAHVGLSGTEYLEKLKTFLPEWPYYTGDKDYPIPGGLRAYDRSENKWDENTTYGQLRYDLCKFWADKLFDYSGD